MLTLPHTPIRTTSTSTVLSSSLAQSLQHSPAKDLSVLVEQAKSKRSNKKRKLDLSPVPDAAVLTVIKEELIANNDGLKIVLDDAADAKSRGRAFYSVVSHLNPTSVSSKLKKSGLKYTVGDLKSSQIELSTVLGNLPHDVPEETTVEETESTIATS